MCSTYVKIYVKDPWLFVVGLVQHVPVAGFYPSLYNLHVLKGDANNQHDQLGSSVSSPRRSADGLTARAKFICEIKHICNKSNVSQCVLFSMLIFLYWLTDKFPVFPVTFFIPLTCSHQIIWTGR